MKRYAEPFGCTIVALVAVLSGHMAWVIGAVCAGYFFGFTAAKGGVRAWAHWWAEGFREGRRKALENRA